MKIKSFLLVIRSGARDVGAGETRTGTSPVPVVVTKCGPSIAKK